MTVEDIQRLKTKGFKKVRKHKRIRIQNIRSTQDLEVHIEQMAEEEEYMTLYEHGGEIG